MSDILSNITIPGITWKKITDQICSGVEGGIAYWAKSFKPEGDAKTNVSPWYSDEKFWSGDFNVKVEIDDEDEPAFLTPESIRKGLEYLAANQLWRIDQIIKESGDAETGDVFIQACLFGDIVYG